MEAETTTSVPQWPTAAGFHNRAAAVFGSLEGSLGGAAGSDRPWSLSQDHVFRAGKANDYSSEEEEDAKEVDHRQREFLPGSLQELEGDNNEDEVFRPSAAFCKAMDKEQEYDDTDAMAMGERLGDADGRPAANTEVLEENVYEQRSRQYEAGMQLVVEDSAAQEAEAMQVEAVSLVGSREHLMPDAIMSVTAVGLDMSEVHEAAAESAPDSLSLNTAEQKPDGEKSSALPEVQDEDEKGRIKKKVRFQEPWVPPHRRDDERGARIRNRPSTVQRQGLPPRTKSYVPDHVRNPQRYTCYTLDEPILVGGGDQGSAAADGGKADLERAARAALSAAQASSQPGESEAAAELPAFGSGIKFRPQSKRKDAQPRSEAADKANKAGSVTGQLLEQEDLDEDAQEAMETSGGIEGPNPVVLQPRKPRRNFRARSAITEEIG